MNSINCTKATQLLKSFQIESAVRDEDNHESATNVSFKRGLPGDGTLIEYRFPKSLAVTIERSDQVYGYLSASLIVKS